MEVSKYFGTENYTQRTDKVKKSLAPKLFDSSCKKYIIWEYLDILALKIIHEVLIYLKNSCEFS